jgi:hypothetical protein
VPDTLEKLNENMDQMTELLEQLLEAVRPLGRLADRLPGKN